MEGNTGLNESIEIIRNIQSAEDFKEKRDELFSSLEKMVKTNLDTLKDILSKGLPQEEIGPEIAKFQQRWETMANEMEPEFNRLDTLPGMSQFDDSVANEFLSRIEPYAMEGEKILAMFKGIEPRGVPGSSPPPKIEKQKLDELEILYGIKTIDELKNSQDLLLDSIGEKFKDILQKLQSFSNMSREEYMAEFQEIVRYQEIFDNEGRVEFERLQALPGGEEYFEIFYGELDSRLGSVAKEIEKLMNVLK